MFEVLPPDWLCPPCQEAKHDECEGAVVFCCCQTEQAIEVEETL